jgi:hypothetical protein
VTDEEEVVGSLLESVGGFVGDEDPTEDIPEHLGWEAGHVQQRVPGAFKLYHGPLAVFDPLFLGRCGFDIGLAAWPIPTGLGQIPSADGPTYVDWGREVDTFSDEAQERLRLIMAVSHSLA